MKVELFEGKALAAALRDSGYDVSDRTVQRWKAGEIAPKPQDVAAIRRVLGVHENDPLKPEWVEGVEDKLGQVLDKQDAIIGALIPAERMAQAVELIGRLEALLPLPSESSPEAAPDTGQDAAGRPRLGGGSLPGRSLEG